MSIDFSYLKSAVFDHRILIVQESAARTPGNRLVLGNVVVQIKTRVKYENLSFLP